MNEELLQLKNFIDRSARSADKLTSKIRIRRLVYSNGFGSERVGHLLNNLCSLNDTTFLDIGCYRGQSTGCATWQNEIKAYALDTFMHDPTSPKPNHSDNKAATMIAFNNNMKLFEANNKLQKVLEVDASTVDLDEFDHEINICYYDAGVQEGLSYKIIDHILPALSKYSIVIGSSLHHMEVCQGIEKAFEKNNVTVHYSLPLKSRMLGDAKSWWNGLKIYLIERELSKQELDKQKERIRKQAIEKANEITRKKEQK